MCNNSIALIGMPGSGKSTVGYFLALNMGKLFIDTDRLIQETEGRSLQNIIDEDGLKKFLAIEEKVILRLSSEHAVIATGGSIIYSSRAMRQLREKAILIYLKVKYAEIQRRIGNMETRGIVLKRGQNLIDLYNERTPLYEKYADITVDCLNKDAEEIAAFIESRYKLFCGTRFANA